MTSPVHSGSGDISRSLELMWQGRERPTRGPRPALNLERIVTAAVELADREGVTALSMRKVAAELGVGTMSLYRYVPGKGELLDLMLDHVQAPGDDLAELRESPWRPALEAVAHGTYRLYLDHPWLLQVNQARPLLGPNALLSFDFALGALEGLGLSGQEKVGIITAVDAYVTGVARQFVLLRQANEVTGLTDEEFWGAQAPLMETAQASGCYPHVFALPVDSFSATAEDTLTFGLRCVLDGIEAFLARK